MVFADHFANRIAFLLVDAVPLFPEPDIIDDISLLRISS
jgi:hypothetical protein